MFRTTRCGDSIVSALAINSRLIAAVLEAYTDKAE